MALTKEFLGLFQSFVNTYRANANSRYISLQAGDKQYKTILTSLDDLLKIFNQYPAEFQEPNIIEHLHSTCILSAKTNPNLLAYWIEFFTNYHNTTGLYASFEEPVSIKTEKMGTSTTRITENLQAALNSAIQSSALAQTAHNNETELLKIQIKELRAENQTLSLLNTELKQQITSREYLESLNPQISLGQQKLKSVLELLETLCEETKERTHREIVNPVLTMPNSIQVHTIPANNSLSDKKPTPEEPSIEAISLETDTSPKQPTSLELNTNQQQQNTAPKPPKITPLRLPEKKQSITNVKFFKSTGDLQNDITSVLKKMKNKQEAQTDPDTPEKKSKPGQ